MGIAYGGAAQTRLRRRTRRRRPTCRRRPASRRRHPSLRAPAAAHPPRRHHPLGKDQAARRRARVPRHARLRRARGAVTRATPTRASARQLHLHRVGAPRQLRRARRRGLRVWQRARRRPGPRRHLPELWRRWRGGHGSPSQTAWPAQPREAAVGSTRRRVLSVSEAFPPWQWVPWPSCTPPMARRPSTGTTLQGERRCPPAVVGVPERAHHRRRRHAERAVALPRRHARPIRDVVCARSAPPQLLAVALRPAGVLGAVARDDRAGPVQRRPLHCDAAAILHGTTAPSSASSSASASSASASSSSSSSSSAPLGASAARRSPRPRHHPIR